MTSAIRDEDLHAFLDGELDDERHREVMEYLDEHPDKLALVATYIEQKRLVREGLEQRIAHDPPETADLAQALARQLRRPPPHQRWRRAAAVALLFGAGWLANSSFGVAIAEPVPDLVEDAAQVHQIFAEDVRRPVEIPGSRSEELARWFSDHFGERVEIPVLRPLGLNLVGGRLLGTEEGPVALLIYEDAQGGRLTLCLSPQDLSEGSEVEIVEIDGLTAGYWQDEELAYALVADTPSEQLTAIAEELGGLPPEGGS